jgi:ribonuclease HI
MSQTEDPDRFQIADDCTGIHDNEIKVTVDGADIQALITANSVTDNTALNSLLADLGNEVEFHSQVVGVFNGSEDITATGHIKPDNVENIIDTLTTASERCGFHVNKLESIITELQNGLPSQPELTEWESESPTWEAHFDGASRGNQGPSAVGAFLTKNGNRVETTSKRVTKGTNNVAEYLALEAALELIAEHDVESITIYGDSQLVIKQVNDDWNANEKLSDYRDLIQREIKSLDCSIELEHVPRTDNRKADKLANKAFE